jgi:transposase
MSQKLYVHLSPEQRAALEKMTRAGEAKAREITRARILLLSDRNQEPGTWKTQDQIAEALSVAPTTVSRICRRFVLEGQDTAAAIKEKPRPGQQPKITGDVEARLVTLACSDPPEGKARWTLRLLRDEMVRLEMVESLSHVAVHTALKKTSLNLGR